MRCPYCGGLNSDQAQFCARCGRDVSAKVPPAQSTAARQRSPYPPAQPQPQQPPYQASRPTPPTQGYPRPTAPHTPSAGQQTREVPPAPAASVASPTRPRTPASGLGQGTPTAPSRATAPEPPAQFPPHTMEHLKALEQGALAYSVIDETETVGRKKIVRILYQRCVPWQQVATLLKAFKEQRADKFDVIIIQGMYVKESSTYGFTNGQLQFDHNVRLGSQITNRYVIETGNGFEFDSVRVVLYE